MIYDPVLLSLIGPRGNGLSPKDRVSPEDLKKVSREFESLFLYELLKNMDVKEGLLGKGLGGDVYNTLFRLEISREMAERGTGLGDMIYESLKRAMGYNVKENPVLDDNIDSKEENSTVIRR
ncbi:MAG: hypothetical protein GXO99_08975 [Nitrospirae bacterium]|nr:hypothetical protein [Nitrospirota bacterium]